MDTKVKQVAEHVANLATEAERLAFGVQQRLYGNQLYIAQEYEQAIDVYLTCLTTVKPHTNGFLRIALANRRLHRGGSMRGKRKRCSSSFGSTKAAPITPTIPARRQRGGRMLR
jgi:hypothetical protein